MPLRSRPVRRPPPRLSTADERAGTGLSLNRLDGAQHTRILWWEEPADRDEQKAGIQPFASVVLHERIACLVKAMRAHVSVNLIAHAAPPIERHRAARGLCELDRAVEGGPGGDLGIRGVLSLRANLPDALVRLAPALLHDLDDSREIDSGRLDGTAAFRQTVLPRSV